MLLKLVLSTDLVILLIDKTFKKFSSIKQPLEAKIFAVNESISSHQLLKLKNNFDKINIFYLSIYSNDRDTIIAGKSLKIDSNFVVERKVKNKLLLLNPKKKDDIQWRRPDKQWHRPPTRERFFQFTQEAEI